MSGILSSSKLFLTISDHVTRDLIKTQVLSIARLVLACGSQMKAPRNNDGLTYFYCDYKDQATHNPLHILKSLAKQFALQDSQSLDELRTFYSAHVPEKGPAKSLKEKELCSLIQNITRRFDNSLVIVDGLDECTGDRLLVVELLSSLNNHANNIKTLFASRDEPDIRQCLEDYTQVSIAAQGTDLILYVAAEIEERTRRKGMTFRNPAVKQQIQVRLVEKADGMFRWVACQLDYLCELKNNRERLQALESLPPDLPSTYERILERVNLSGVRTQLMVQRALRWIVCVKNPLPLNILAEAVSIRPDQKHIVSAEIDDESAILRWCSSLIRESPNHDGLELAHFTVKEFLLAIDPDKQSAFRAYRISPEKCRLEIARTCIRYLSFDNFDNLYYENIETMTDYIRISCSEVQESDEEELLADLKHLFSPCKSRQFFLWSQDYAISAEYGGGWHDGLTMNNNAIKHYTSVSDSSTLHWAALLRLSKLCSWLCEAGCDANRPSRFLGTPLTCVITGKGDGFGNTRWMQYTRGTTEQCVVGIVQDLIKAEANINYQLGDSGYEPRLRSILELAIQYSNCGIAIVLLDAGAVWNRSCTEIFRHNRQVREQLSLVLDSVTDKNIRIEDKAHLTKLALEFESSKAQDLIINTTLSEKVSQPLLADHQEWLCISAASGQIKAVDALLRNFRIVILLLTQRRALPRFIWQWQRDIRGCTALLVAAELGQGAVFNVLLEFGSSLLDHDAKGWSVLHFAAENSDIEILQFLESNGRTSSTLHTRTSDGRTPIIVAASNGSLDVIKFFWEHWKDTNLQDETPAKWSCLHFAADNFHVEVMSFLLDHGLNVNHQATSGMTPLILLVSRMIEEPNNRGLSGMKLLLGHQADPNASNIQGRTALHYLCDRLAELAIENAALEEALHLLLIGGARVGQPDGEGQSCFEILLKGWGKAHTTTDATRGSTHTPRLSLRLLARYATNKDLPNKQFWNIFPLALSLEGGDEQLAERLMKLGADVDQQSKDERRLNALQLACLKGCGVSLTKQLLTKSSAISIRDTKGYNLLHLVCIGGVVEIGRKLLELRVALNEQASDGNTPLMLATNTGHLEMIIMLLESGADVSLENSEGWNVLHFAARYGNPAILSLLTDSGIGCGGTAMLTCHSRPKLRGATALHIAAYFGNISTVEHFLKHTFGQAVNHIDNSERLSPLFLAVLVGAIDTVSLLLSNGANANLTASDGWLPLHMAAYEGDVAIVLVLLDYTTNPWQLNNNGNSPELVAVSAGWDQVARVLRDHAGKQSSCISLPTNPCLRGQTSGDIFSAIDRGDLEHCDRLVGDLGSGTVLNVSSVFGNVGAIELLLSQGVFPDSTNICRKSSSYLAAQYSHHSALQCLLKAGANPNIRTLEGKTAAIAAAENGHLDIPNFLLQQQADIAALDVLRRGCLYYAALHGHTKVLKFLVTLEGDLALPDLTELTPVHVGFKSCSYSTQLFLLSRCSIPNIQSSLFGNILNHACANSRAVFVNNKSQVNNTPLYAAALLDRVDIIQLLLDTSAEIEACGGQYGTSLMAACAMGRLQAARALVANGAKLSCVDQAGVTRTAVECAKHHSELVTWLASLGDSDVQISSPSPF
ncbi:Ankyrin repeat domain-containing protein 44 [Xylographa soralifera]|nr:Ankyrin repeat domain-containing protein 44 [Xylographa soralifera]